MRTAYLVRKNTWMSDGERRVARKIAREGENRLYAGLMTMDAVSAVVFYSAGCAAAVLGRVSERYVQMLAAGEDVSTMQEVYERAQGGVLMAARAMEVLIAGRLRQEEAGERDWFGEVVLKGKEGEGELDRINKICRMDRIPDEEQTMVGDRVASREMAVGFAAGALGEVALVEDSARVARAAARAGAVPDDIHYTISARLDEAMAEQEARKRGEGNGKASTTKDTKGTKAGGKGEETGVGGSGASGTLAFPNGNSGTRGKGEEIVEGGEFARLSRRERRFVERLARKEAKKGRRVAA